ncbi:hypothetical protein DMUE_0083 [Dictyocoela muelleri]|nr:hypothetical protein DMUE_0083 [Dictyocoela muelleri]
MEYNIKSLYDDIFLCQDDAFNFLSNLGILNRNKPSFNCGNTDIKLRKDKNRLNSCYFNCGLCNKKFGLTKGTIIENFKKPLNIFLRIVYGFIINLDYCQMQLLTLVAPNTFLKIKKN